MEETEDASASLSSLIIERARDSGERPRVLKVWTTPGASWVSGPGPCRVRHGSQGLDHAGCVTGLRAWTMPGASWVSGPGPCWVHHGSQGLDHAGCVMGLKAGPRWVHHGSQGLDHAGCVMGLRAWTMLGASRVSGSGPRWVRHGSQVSGPAHTT